MGLFVAIYSLQNLCNSMCSETFKCNISFWDVVLFYLQVLTLTGHRNIVIFLQVDYCLLKLEKIFELN